MRPTDTVNWPLKLDTWPSLSNFGESFDTDSVTLYAEHYNKIAKYLVKVQTLQNKGALNLPIGVTSISTLFTFSFPLASLLVSNGFSYIGNDIFVSTNPQSGSNSIYYQFGITNNSHNYNAYITALNSMSKTPVILQAENTAVFDNVDLYFTGADFHCNVTIKPTNKDLGFGASMPQTREYKTTCKVLQNETEASVAGRDLIIIEGLIERNQPNITNTYQGHDNLDSDNLWYGNLMVNFNLIVTNFV